MTDAHRPPPWANWAISKFDGTRIILVGWTSDLERAERMMLAVGPESWAEPVPKGTARYVGMAAA